jgi:hypothetical protein
MAEFADRQRPRLVERERGGSARHLVARGAHERLAALRVVGRPYFYRYTRCATGSKEILFWCARERDGRERA